MIDPDDIVVPYRRSASANDSRGDVKSDIIVRTGSLGFFIFMSTVLIVIGFSPHCNTTVSVIMSGIESDMITEDER
jgi:hypothetical protein